VICLAYPLLKRRLSGIVGLPGRIEADDAGLSIEYSSKALCRVMLVEWHARQLLLSAPCLWWGMAIKVRTVIMAMTTINSMRVNPRDGFSKIGFMLFSENAIQDHAGSCYHEKKKLDRKFNFPHSK